MGGGGRALAARVPVYSLCGTLTLRGAEGDGQRATAYGGAAGSSSSEPLAPASQSHPLITASSSGAGDSRAGTARPPALRVATPLDGKLRLVARRARALAALRHSGGAEAQRRR